MHACPKTQNHIPPPDPHNQFTDRFQNNLNTFVSSESLDYLSEQASRCSFLLVLVIGI